MEIEGKAKACLEWAKTWDVLDGYLKLNAFVNKDGEAALNTVYNSNIIEPYIDGTAKRQYSFMFKMMLPWSDGIDDINVDSENIVAQWLDWVSRQYPDNVPEWDGAEILSIEPDQNTPALDSVDKEEGLAAYSFKAVIMYIE